MSSSAFTYKITFSMKLKIFALFLLIFFTIFVAVVYSYSTKASINCIKSGSGVTAKHIINIRTNINSSIIYKNSNYGKYTTITISDMEIINNVPLHNKPYFTHTINFKLKTIFGIEHKKFTYKIKNIKIPVNIYAFDSLNYYESSLNSTNIITTNSDTLTFKGKTFPFTTIYINNGEETILSDEKGEFEITEDLKEDVSSFTFKFKYKNLKPIKINFNIQKIIQN